MVEFLTALFHQGLGYSALNSARSALSTSIVCDGVPVGQHPLVVRLLKGVFQLRPALPRNEVTWDPDIVLSYLKHLSPVKTISLKMLSLKLVTLLALLSGHRAQTLHLLDVKNMSISKNSAKFRFGDLLKQSRPGKHQAELSLKAYAPDRRLCIVTVLQEYLRRTREIRKHSQLFISFIQPHTAVSKSTISRWLKQTLSTAGWTCPCLPHIAPEPLAQVPPAELRFPLTQFYRQRDGLEQCFSTFFASRPKMSDCNLSATPAS